MFAYFHRITEGTLSLPHFPFLVSLSCPPRRMEILPVPHQNDVQKATTQKINSLKRTLNNNKNPQYVLIELCTLIGKLLF